MSWILAVETSTEWCSVALGRLADGGALECLVRHEHTGPRSSSRVLPAAELLAEAGIALSDCAAIAFGAGPGSFTGLRTARGVAQGLAFGADLPVIPVNSLMACADARAPGRRGDARLAARRLGAGCPGCAHGRSLCGRFPLGCRRARVAGDRNAGVPARGRQPAGRAVLAGRQRCCRVWRAPQGHGDGAAKRARSLPAAPALVSIALRALARMKPLAAADAMPIYLRDKVAQTIAERQAAAAQRASLAAAGEQP
ncbi:tRNA (adenosine(37)-N6)-threonylcarbamoyltransferase complex dimerization subunit type 1 TsaB [Cupriavidus basilensis]